MAKYGYFYRLPAFLGSSYLNLEVTSDPRTPKIPSLHKRSRGTHMPGDGDYVNRYVFDDCVRISNNGVLSIDRSGVDPGVGIYKEPCTGIAYSTQLKAVVACLSCRISGTQGNQWWGHLWAWYFDHSRWRRYNPMHIYCNRDIYLGRYYDMSQSAAWSAFSGFIDLYKGASYADAPHLIGAQSETYCSLYNVHNDGIVPGPELQFSPSMDYYDLRNEIGDYTVNSRGGIAAAFIDAADKLPNLSDMNNVANGFQLLGALKSSLLVLLGKDKLSNAASGVRAAKDAWLSYRYVYNTTKADCEEVLSYANRILGLLGSSVIRSNGYYRESDWTVRCSITCKTDALDGVRSILQKYGLRLTPYNAWDLVPYSFIVDWFFDIGEFLEEADKRNFALSVSPCEIWYSIERRWVNEYGFHEIYYYRFSSQASPDLSWVSRQSHGSRVSTWVKRGLDLVALFG